jgi:MFS family permease
MRATLIGTLLVGVFSGAAINNIASAPLSLIADDFATTPERITLVASASGFALACCMPVSGWLSVRWGSRRILVGAFALLGLGCLLAGLAPSVWVLVVGRVVQGIAMSVVPPTVMYVLPELMGADRRERGLGWWAVANGAGTAAGAPLGALIADTLGWRMMFLPFVPACGTLAVACFWMKADAEPQRRLDARSAVLLTVALVFLIGPPMAVGAPVSTAVLGAMGAVGVITSLAFVWSLRRAESPFVDPGFLRSQGFAVGSLGGAAQMFVLGSISVLVPLVGVQVYGYSVRVAGLFVLVVTVTMMVSAPPISGLVPRYGARRLILWGLGLASASVAAAAATLSSGLVVLTVLACLLMLGVALGLLQSPSAIAVSCEPSSRGSGVGLYNSIRFGGGVVGVGWLSLAAHLGATSSQALLLAAAPVLAAGVVVALLH